MAAPSFKHRFSFRRRAAASKAVASSLVAALCLRAAQWAAASPFSFVLGGHNRNAADVSRRGLLVGGFGGAALAGWNPGSALAEDNKGPIQAFDVIGVTGKRASEMNGRWAIMLGQTINKRPVYKRDGANLYLIYGDCGKFQMSESLSGECNGFGISEKDLWTIDGKEMPSLKVSAARSKNTDEEEAARIKAAIRAERAEAKRVREAAAKAAEEEKQNILREASVMTFRGVMSDDQEAVGDRLMKKLGAKIVEGM